MPAPLSPWKYSWKSSRSCQCGSRWNFSMPPNTGRRPSSSSVKVEVRRRLISVATSSRFISRPEPVGAEELLLVEHDRKDPTQPLLVDERGDAPALRAGVGHVCQRRHRVG